MAVGILETLAVAVDRPREIFDRLEGRRQRRGQEGVSVEADFLNVLDATHHVMGIGECSECELAIGRVWAETQVRLGAGHHHDGGPALAGALWSIVFHLAPDTVVETGVARGVSSAFVLDAMERNRRGHLWSIDLPPLAKDWNGQTGIAVDPSHRYRWTYVRGSSKRELSPLLRHLDAIDVFVHDGLHTGQNMKMEFDSAWPKIRPGGVLVSDDIDDNPAWANFAPIGSVVIAEPGKSGAIGLARRARASA